jgi:subtilisin family serine protease
MLALAFLLVQAAWGLAPFLAQQEPIDRHVNGVQQRSYFVIFNERAPMFGLAKEKLQSWLPTAMPELEPENVQWIYEIDTFRGFAVWAVPASITSVLAHDFIKYVEEDQVMRVAAPFTGRADWGQVRASQKGARNLATVPSGQYSGTSYPSGSADTNTWDWTTAVYNGYRPINNGALAKIWIVDTGVLPNHQEFVVSGRSRVTTNVDYVNSSAGGVDCNGHGSHCAGSAAGLYRGLASNADIGNVRVLSCSGSGTNTAVVNGFNYVCNNPASGKTNILSASLGGGVSQATDDAINSCNTRGITAVVAAGNNGANACNYSPARATGAVTVGATTKDDSLASFSNSGSCVNILSPGVSIHSAWYTSSTNYNTISGTSMATPLVAGAIALYATSLGASAQPVTPANIKAALSRTATNNTITGLPANTPNQLVNANWT